VEGEGGNMDKEAAIELFTILLEIFRDNNIKPPVELDAMMQGIMMGNKYMVIHNLYTLLKIIIMLTTQGELDITYDEQRRIRELVEKLAMS
jgi:hypothetical protein